MKSDKSCRERDREREKREIEREMLHAGDQGRDAACWRSRERGRKRCSSLRLIAAAGVAGADEAIAAMQCCSAPMAHGRV